MHCILDIVSSTFNPDNVSERVVFVRYFAGPGPTGYDRCRQTGLERLQWCSTVDSHAVILAKNINFLVYRPGFPAGRR